jgi:Fe-S oxidoreductase
MALGNTNTLGAIGKRIPALMNWANKNPLTRWMMEKTVGIHRNKKLPEYHPQTFVDWYDHREASKPSIRIKDPVGKVALFYTCTVNFNNPDVGKKCIAVLEHNNVEAVVPAQVCCGMPQLGTGNYDATTKAVDTNTEMLKKFVDEGYTIVTPGPSCGYMMRQEYPHLATDAESASTIARNTMDICEYLMSLNDKKKLKTDFTAVPEKVTYHLPCHLRAQNIGFKSRDLMKLIPGVEIEMVQQCSGHDGSWSMKKEYYEISLEVGKKLASRIEREKLATVASDCLLAHLHIDEMTHEQAKHPIEILHAAYGL